MIIPPTETASGSGRAEAWSRLAPEAKTERLLGAAATVFAQHGLEAPMSEVAEAAGAGVASVYRQFPSKRDLLTALVIRRQTQLTAAAQAAREQPGDRWSAFTDLLRTMAATQSADDFMGVARAAVSDHPDVQAGHDRMMAELERVLDSARREGRLRSDATTLDLRLLLAATRAARRVEGALWPRMLELMIDAFDTQPRQS